MQASAHALFVDLLPAALGSLRGDVPPFTYLIRVEGEGGGTFFLDLKAKSSGASGPRAADCTIDIGSADLAKILGGELTMEDLFYAQRLAVDGSVDAVAVLPAVIARCLSPFPAVGLAPLIAPLSPERFLNEYWPHKMLHVEGPLARLGGFSDIPELTDVHRLLESWRGLIRVFPPGDDDYLTPHVHPDVAKRLYDEGFTLVFSCVDQRLPHLGEFLAALTRDLGLPRNTWGRCMMYANPPTPPGHGTKKAGLNPHFDENANFAIQLLGDKAWEVAPNPRVKDPTTSHLMSLPAPQPELAVQIDGELPRTMPADSQTVNLRPGSVLFMPRAWWHATTSRAHSLSLNFTFSQPGWADVVLGAMRRKLVAVPAWRELAMHVDSADPARAAAARAKLGKLLATLGAEVQTLTPEGVVATIADRAVDEIDTVDVRRDWYAAVSHFGFGNKNGAGE
jgi:50S ribosomal protein L16 3-hydroxylase